MVPRTRDHAQLDALQPDGGHLVGGLHYGGVVDQPNVVPGTGSYPFSEINPFPSIVDNILLPFDIDLYYCMNDP